MILKELRSNRFDKICDSMEFNDSMKIKMKKYITGIALLCITMLAHAGDLPGEIVNAISSGNAVALSKYFNNTVELTIFDKEGVYSNTQAEMILKDFFTQYPPAQFKILHQGGKESSKYAIGSLTSKGKTYRITLFFKSEGSQVLIHQFRVENEYVE